MYAYAVVYGNIRQTELPITGCKISRELLNVTQQITYTTGTCRLCMVVGLAIIHVYAESASTASCLLSRYFAH